MWHHRVRQSRGRWWRRCQHLSWALPASLQLQLNVGTLILLIHATSDIESDGGEARRTISVITVNSAGAKVSVAVWRSRALQRLDQLHSTRQGDQKRASPYHRRAGSPRWRRLWGRSDYSRRPSVTYTVGAEGYRRFQGFMQQSRYKK